MTITSMATWLMTIVGALLCSALMLARANTVVRQELVLPRTVKVCQHEQQDYASCLRLALQESWMTFVKGIPELELPAIDPFHVELYEQEISNQDMQIRKVLRNSTGYGLAKARFLAVRPTRTGSRMSFEVDVELPKFFVEGYYKIDGLLGSHRIGGRGYYNVSMEGVSMTWALEGEVADDRWLLEHFHVYPEVEAMRVYFTDLFNGDEALNQMALAFVNQYWKLLLTMELPVMEKMSDEYLTREVNRVLFSRVSAAKLFP